MNIHLFLTWAQKHDALHRIAIDLTGFSFMQQEQKVHLKLIPSIIVYFNNYT